MVTILRVPIVLAFLLILSLSAEAQTLYEQHISKGLSSLHSNDYNTSEIAFREALKEKPDDYKATLCLGIVLNRKGNKEAESLLKKALFMNPQDPQANFELGIYYYNRSIYSEAEDYFETTMELSPYSRFSEEAQTYIYSIKGEKRKIFHLDASLGIQYDDNVILGPVDAPFPTGIEKKSDWRALIYIRGQYDMLRTENLKGSLNYTFYQSLHTELSDFNISQHALGGNAFHELSNATLKVSYTFEYIFVGEHAYDFAHTVIPSVTIKEGRGFSTSIHYKYSRTKFIDTDLFKENSERTGSNSLIGITQNIQLGAYIETKIGYSYDNDATREDYWDYSGNKGFLNIAFRLPHRMYTELYWEYYDKNYEAEYPGSGEIRKDFINTYSVTLMKGISNSLSIVLGQLYIRNKSNIDVFNYQRSISSLYIVWRF